MPCRLRDLSIATTVLSLTVTVTIVVSLLGTSMYATVGAMASVSEDLAFGLAHVIVDERGKYLALEVETRLFRPMREVVKVGAAAALGVGGGDILDWPQSVRCAHTMLEHLEGSTYLFPREAWVSNEVGGLAQIAIKSFFDDDGSKVLKVMRGNISENKYHDRYPVPLEEDIVERDAAGDNPAIPFTRGDGVVDYLWTPVTSDRFGQMEMGYGGPILKGNSVDDNVFVFTESPLILLKPLLQSLVGGGEDITGAYDAAYVPILNETTLCVVEADSGLLVACSHGLSALKINGSWHRVKGEQSDHPIIGPGLQARSTLARGEVFTTTGTARFPLAKAMRYFIRVEALLNGPQWSRVVITPYDQLLMEVEEKTNEERESAIAKILTTVLISVGVALIAILASGLMTAKVSRPLSDLVLDMQRMEVMDTAGVMTSEDGPVSMVLEVEEMKVSFLAMVKMLVEYKSFIPKHLVEVDETESSDEMRSDRSGSMNYAASSSHAVNVSNVKSMFTLELGARQCTVCTLMVAPGKKHKGELAPAINSLLERVLSACAGMNPYITLTFDSVVIGFNAATKLMSYKEQGLRCILELSQSTSPLAVGCSYEVAQAYVGNVGTTATRFYAVYPEEKVRSRVLPAYAAAQGWGSVYCNEQVVVACQNFLFLKVDVVEDLNTKEEVARCLSEKREDTEEWMYSLDEANTLPHATFNKAFGDMLAGKLADAAAGFESCKARFPEADNFLVLLSRGGASADPSWYMRQKAQ